MSKEICISSTPHETRLAIIEDDQPTELYYERENEYTLAGSIYKGRVTRVLPGMQSAFVDIGLERDAFLYVTDFLEEQEDSADFERSPAASDGGAQRQSSAAKPSVPRAPEPEGELGKEPDAFRKPDEAGTEEVPEGTRRWRGRRGRRGRGLRARSTEAPGETGSQGQPPRQHFHAGDQPDDRGEAVRENPGEAARENRGGNSGLREHEATHAERTGQRRDFQAGADLLPGESLSKYGQPAASSSTGDSTEVSAGTARVERHAKAAVPVVHSHPSTLIENPIEWSGAGLLPGESRSGTSAPPPSADQPSEVDENASASHRVDPAAPSELRIFSRSSHHAKHEDHHEDDTGHSSEPRAEREDAGSPLAGDDAQEPSEEASAAEPAETEPFFEPLNAVSFDTEQESGTPNQPESQEHPLDEPLRGDHPDERFATLMRDLHSASSESFLEEEELVEEEESDRGLPAERGEEHEYEELEEETLDSDSAASLQVGEVMRETHLEQRVEADPSTFDSEQTGTGEDEIVAEPETAEESLEGVTPQTEPRGRREARHTDRGVRRGGRGRNGRRQSAQTSSLPIISELLKQGQEILVQIAKEPIAKKGARITSHIALPGRFLVFMPTVNHIGVSRKISSDQERQRLKRILNSEKGTNGGGFIVRTAAEGASEDDLRADIRFLINLWGEIKQREESGKAPALIYHDLNLVERILRDRVSDNFSAIWVDNEAEYERIVRFLNRFQPSLVRRVKLYTKQTPLFEQFGIQEEIGKALKSKVWLKSGGSIVINQTEALVAIDINTGKYVGKTARLEDTILKTNLDAIPEIVRQIRLRDLGGIIVIDFIDMDERRNRHKVMQALEEELKSDRAPSKVLQFNDFGLVAITRKRVKQSLERTLCVPCETCGGTGMVKSPVTVTNEIYVEMRKMQHTFENNDVLLRVHPEVVKTLKADNGRWLTEIEEICGKTVLVKSDPSLSPEQFDIH